MVLVFLFMAGYYFMDSPSQRVARQELDQAIIRTDLRSIAECAAAAHTAVIKNGMFEDICTQEYSVKSEIVCLNEKFAIMKCETAKNKKPAASFIITSTASLAFQDYNSMLEVLETYYLNVGTFGVFLNNVVLSGDRLGKRTVPKSIVDSLKLVNGQMVYMTQYEIPNAEVEYLTTPENAINCPAGTVAVYRFGRWQCAMLNEKPSCPGDKIWDYDILECVPDNSRRPLCGGGQTAVMVDDLWECIDPFLEKNCPAGMIATLNYSSLEWECLEDPSVAKPTKKCVSTQRGAVYGELGSTLRISSGYCTDCEEMVTDMDTCSTTCVPAPGKINDPKCYPSASECSGTSRAFYFGFPNLSYASRVSNISGYAIPLDKSHSQNRKFNCLDCGAGRIDTDKSKPPFIAVCE